MEKEIEFGKLRLAYLTVKRFLEDQSWEKVTSLETKVADDLSLFGDDNYEMLVKFIEKFELEYEEFEYDEHFHSEGELFSSDGALYNLLILSVWLPLKTIELLTLNKLKIKKPEFYKLDREVSDLTFRQLLTWYVEGKYTSDQITYKIKTPHNNVYN